MMNDIPPGNPLLSTRNLVVGYRQGHHEHSLLQQLNLSLQAGELVCFMGINGIGKSSLVRTLAGLQSPLSGDILYAGQREKNDLSKILSVVLTDKIAAPAMTVYELISFGRYPYLDWTVRLEKDDTSVIERAIGQVNINALRNKRLYDLSDGQLQLAMIARALSQDGDIILLDEPTAHLDLNNKIEIMNLLKDLARITKKAILVATHELDLVLQTADVVWLAGNNKNILTGIPEDLILNGSFDEVFQFKGFDLKTGTFRRQAYRNILIRLEGTGEYFHWTKKALERAGYTLSNEGSLAVVAPRDAVHPVWLLTSNGHRHSAGTLQELLTLILKLTS